MGLLNKIQSGNRTAFTELYSLYRNEFILWACKNYTCREDEAKDVFQEVIIDFYKTVTKKNNFKLTSNLKTYLFAIGKHKLINLIKKNSRNSNFSNSELINDKLFTSNLAELEHKEEYDKEQIKNLFKEIPKDCKKILDLYYVQNWDIDSIAKELDSPSANSTKKRKFDCLQKLAKFIKSQNAKILVF